MAEATAISEQGVQKLNAAYGEGGWALEKDRGGTWRVVRKSTKAQTPTAPESAEETATAEST